MQGVQVYVRTWTRPCRWPSTSTCTFHEKGFLILRAVVTPTRFRNCSTTWTTYCRVKWRRAAWPRWRRQHDAGSPPRAPAADSHNPSPARDPRALHARSTHFARDCRADRAGRLALQTMLFGKRWAALSTGVPHHHRTDTLLGAWDALDRADTENGFLWTTPGRQHEPVYPMSTRRRAMAGPAARRHPIHRRRPG
jgi:Phytanoyl-CoA dioxygenase (PhyH)